ncbi:MAG: class II fructose-bisphosphate aldolase [Chthoniobacteraceae bacterium]
MPIITDRVSVLNVFAEAKRNGWVIPAFGTENLTTTEAVLATVKEHGETCDCLNLPVMLAVTNCYPQRTQTAYYTQTRDWRIGLELFLADLAVLTGPDSPFAHLRVLVHLDHIQHDLDAKLWEGDLSRFSSIMFDASTLPFEENVAFTRKFMDQRQSEIVIEGACDYVGTKNNPLTQVEEAERFAGETGVDWVVANLGTEHRAGASSLCYARDRAREISAKIGQRLVLHGTSSVAIEQWPNLFSDGIVRVNLWTALERDSAGPLLRDMVHHAAKVVGSLTAAELLNEGLLGAHADTQSPAMLSHFTTAWRQQLVFEQMKHIVKRYLEAWYPQV